jgi:hypothetical protein
VTLDCPACGGDGFTDHDDSDGGDAVAVADACRLCSETGKWSLFFDLQQLAGKIPDASVSGRWADEQAAKLRELVVCALCEDWDAYADERDRLEGK